MNAAWVRTLPAGAVVALATWTPAFEGPTVGLDPSWRGGLHMALDQGLDFGTEVVFTYGPLGFLGLSSAQLWFGDLAVVAFLFLSLLYFALCVSLVFALRRSIGLPAAIAVAFGALALSADVEQSLVVVMVWGLVVLSSGEERPRFALEGLIAGGATLAAIETLVKLSVGPVIVAVCLVVLIGTRAAPRHFAGFVGLFAVELPALWLISGQGLGELGEYLSNGRQIVSGYSEAMGLFVVPHWQVLAAVVTVAALAITAFTQVGEDRRQRLCAAAVALLIGFVIYKQDIVRLGGDHMEIFFSTALLLWLAIPWRGRSRIALAGGGLAFAVLVLHTSTVTEFRWNPVENAAGALDGARTALSPARRDAITDDARTLMKDTYAIDSETLALLADRRVAIDPWEIGVAWAYELDWAPFPVIQSYAAYTEGLDELNLAAAETEDGPEVILRHERVPNVPGQLIRTIDQRYPGWDPPGASLAVLCNFEELRTTPRWQVLGRIEDRCSQPQAAGTVEAAYGEEVPVPGARAGEVIFVRIEGAEVSGPERLRTLLYRAEFREATVNGSAVYRLVPGTAADGLLLAGAPGLTGTGTFAQAPQAETISLDGLDGDLRYDFFRMEVGTR